MVDENKKSSAGFTLLEALIVIAIISTVTTLAVSSWSDVVAQKRTRATLDALADSLKLARSESIKRRATITVSFRDHAGTQPSWCYGLSDVGDCDCRAANACTIDGTEYVITDADYPIGLTATGLSGPDGAKYIEFEGIRGTVTEPGSVQLINRGYSGRVSINAMGFISNCSANIAGYPSC